MTIMRAKCAGVWFHSSGDTAHQHGMAATQNSVEEVEVQIK
jgi:hypothetical protein